MDPLTRDEIGSMTLRQLEGMTRDQVLALPDDARQLRRERLLDDPTPRGLTWIASTFGLTRSGVAKWRGEYLRNGGRETENALPKPMNEADGCKLPGESGPAGASPIWPAGQIRGWGHRYNGLDEDFFPTGGRKSTGRPPKHRSDLVTVERVVA